MATKRAWPSRNTRSATSLPPCRAAGWRDGVRGVVTAFAPTPTITSPSRRPACWAGESGRTCGHDGALGAFRHLQLVAQLRRQRRQAPRRCCARPAPSAAVRRDLLIRQRADVDVQRLLEPSRSTVMSVLRARLDVGDGLRELCGLRDILAADRLDDVTRLHAGLGRRAVRLDAATSAPCVPASGPSPPAIACGDGLRLHAEIAARHMAGRRRAGRPRP